MKEIGGTIVADCKNCKYAVWDYEEYYPCVKHYVVSDCKLDNFVSGEDVECEDFDEYLPPLPDGF